MSSTLNVDRKVKSFIITKRNSSIMRVPSYLLFLLILIASGKGDAKKGNDAYNNQEYAKAEAFYRTALEAEPERSEIYFNLGNTLAKQGKTEEAIQTFMEYLPLAENPADKAKAQYNIGTILASGEQWEPAAMHLRNSLMLNPDDTEARHNYEKVLAELDKKEQEEEQEQQQDNKPQDPPTAYALEMKKNAEQLVKERKYKEAFDLMQNALQIDKTVSNFNDFIQRIGDVDEIDS